MPLREVLEDDKYFYTVMKKAQDGTLFEDLHKRFNDGVIPSSTLKNLMMQILRAVGHIHKHGLLHRDIKPDNIVVQQGAAMLIDFDHADPDWNPSRPKHLNEFFGT